jgi:hypothetical protein
MMNPKTMMELERQLQRIKLYESGPASSSLRNIANWATWILAVVGIAAWIPFTSDGPRFVFPMLCLLIGLRSVFAIIQYNVNKRLRPILEALLDIPENVTKQRENG